MRAGETYLATASGRRGVMQSVWMVRCAWCPKTEVGEMGIHALTRQMERLGWQNRVTGWICPLCCAEEKGAER